MTATAKEIAEKLVHVYSHRIEDTPNGDVRSTITAALEEYGKEQYNRAIEDAARIADRDDQSAWGIALHIRALAQKDVKP